MHTYQKWVPVVTDGTPINQNIYNEKGEIIDTETIIPKITTMELQNVECTEEEYNGYLRALRREKCFSVINRGQLWYQTLTTDQLAELTEWYQAWLNVTNTQVEPTKPTWLITEKD